MSFRDSEFTQSRYEDDQEYDIGLGTYKADESAFQTNLFQIVSNAGIYCVHLCEISIYDFQVTNNNRTSYIDNYNDYGLVLEATDPIM